MAFSMSRVYHVGALLFALVGLGTPYFPGLDPEADLTVLCQQAQSYTVGGTLGTGDSDVAIETNMDSYIPHKQMKVSVTSGRPFVGLILQARKLGSTTSYGNFSLPKNYKEALRNCDRTNDTVFLWLDSARAKVTVTWMPSTQDMGTLQFFAIVFEQDGTYWPGITSDQLRQGFAPITVDTCGTDKGCFRYNEENPACDEDTCEYMLTYAVKGKYVHFEMVGDLDWVAVGFSSDDMMGGDDVYMCVNLRTGPEVRHYENEYQHNAPVMQDDDVLENEEVTIGEDGRIKCRFTRQLKANTENSVDLNNDWYQMYAWGEVSNSGQRVTRHRKKPSTSSRKMTLFHKLNVMNAAPLLAPPILLVQLSAFLFMFN